MRRRFLATLLAAAMVLSLTACGQKEETQTQTPADTTETKVETPKVTSTPTPIPYSEDRYPMTISVYMPSDEEHIDENPWYTKLTEEIASRTGMTVEWGWQAAATYYDDEHLGLQISTQNVADIITTNLTDTFLEAANNGLFWDLAPYIKDYDNLASIPDAVINAASDNGKLFGIPRSRNLGRNGIGFRMDWLNALGLDVPETWDDYKEMLRAFTEDDPDGNGQNDTVGLGVDSWTGCWDILMTWFNVPNEWGLTADDKLIHKYETAEYKTALKEIRDLYSKGYINNGSNGIDDFRDVGAGKARSVLGNSGKAGAGIQVLDDQRKICTALQDAGFSPEPADNDGSYTEDDLPYRLAGWIDAGYGPKTLPFQSGFAGVVAISTTNIKTEAQLRRVLAFMNDMADGSMANLIEYGWEGVTYKLDDDGYVSLITGEDLTTNLGGSYAKYAYGFNQIIPYFMAENNARPVTTAPASTVIRKLEDSLKAENEKYVVPNYGVSFKSATAKELNTQLSDIMTTAQLNYIVGDIDETGLEAAIAQWKAAGGDKVTAEMNEMYAASKKK